MSKKSRYYAGGGGVRGCMTAKKIYFSNFWDGREPINEGCHTLSHEDCCNYFDNRDFDFFKDENCIPTKDGGTTYSSGNYCEPETWVDQFDIVNKGSCTDSNLESSARNWKMFFFCIPEKNFF